MNQAETEVTHCGVCGQKSEQAIPPDNANWEAVDLDTRPAAPLRGTLEHWLQHCPHCGYCGPDLSQAHPDAAQHMAAEGYVATVHDSNLPESSNRLLRRSHLEESAGELASAAWYALFAAWGADDARQAEVARRCRKRAADCFQAAVALDQPLADQPGDGEAVLVDVFRRAGMMTEARLAAERTLEQISDPLINRLLQFQLMLIERSDSGMYTGADLPPG